MAHLRVTTAFIFLCFLSSLSKDVSSVVGAPWRCGVLSTKGGIAGFGLGESMIQLTRAVTCFLMKHDKNDRN